MDLPSYDSPDFATDFRPKHGPGFFPGAGGYFHGCSPEGPRRIAFFGTDFGTQTYWEDEVAEGQGEKRTQATLCNLRCLIEEARVDPCSCHLTNTVLALAKRANMTGNDSLYGQKRYRYYLEEKCRKFHEDWISRHSPKLVVLMGTPNVDMYRQSIFQHIFPELKQWEGFGAPWESIYDAKKELVRTGPGEPDILWMFHPSYRHSNPQFRRLSISRAEKRKRREEVWERTAAHLRGYV